MVDRYSVVSINDVDELHAVDPMEDKYCSVPLKAAKILLEKAQGGGSCRGMHRLTVRRRFEPPWIREPFDGPLIEPERGGQDAQDGHGVRKDVRRSSQQDRGRFDLHRERDRRGHPEQSRALWTI